ncbi:MAG TPA: copper chaperone PCu(A)C [Caulobacteraceae bacterium]|jgi:copper(I)-binding protein|nr:copper chaperone PCu(A)C [Caulobacteraceae bacterium]
MKPLVFALLTFLAAPAAASAAIVIEHPEIRPTLGSQGTGAAYLVIRNTGAAPDRLIGASCACAASVMAHRTTTENGVSHMEMEMAVPVPAHGTVVFDARGRHLMLTGIKTPIRAGAKVPMVLSFERAGKVAAVFSAADLAGMGAAAADSHPKLHP